MTAARLIVPLGGPEAASRPKLAARLIVRLGGPEAASRPKLAAHLIVRLDGPQAASRPNITTIISKGGGYVDAVQFLGRGLY